MSTQLLSWLRRRKPQAESPIGPRRLVGVGHSHLQAMQYACALREQADPPARPQTRFLQMQAPQYNPNLLADGSLNPALAEALGLALREDTTPPLLFDSVSGNEYHFIGLVNHPRPYDFVLPGRPDLPLRADVEVIPAALLRQSLEALVGPAFATMKALRAAVAGPIWHVQSPPPLPDNEYIRAHPTHFAEQVAERGVAPPAFRLKLWLLQSEIYRAKCKELGFGFIPVPEAACDPDGFLRPEGWQPDPAHANAWYGALVLQQLETLAEGPGT